LSPKVFLGKVSSGEIEGQAAVGAIPWALMDVLEEPLHLTGA